MRGLAVLALVLVAVAVASAKPADKYTTKYDNVDLDEILKNKRLLNSYVKCLLSKGNCTPDGAELKKVLPDAIASECSGCSETQRNGSRKVLRHLINNEPTSWAELEKKYDPTGAYKKKYCAQAKEEGIINNC